MPSMVQENQEAKQSKWIWLNLSIHKQECWTRLTRRHTDQSFHLIEETALKWRLSRPVGANHRQRGNLFFVIALLERPATRHSR